MVGVLFAPHHGCISGKMKYYTAALHCAAKFGNVTNVRTNNLEAGMCHVGWPKPREGIDYPDVSPLGE
jgi:hypothetical protein